MKAALVSAALIIGAALLAVFEIHRHAAALLWPLFVFILDHN